MGKLRSQSAVRSLFLLLVMATTTAPVQSHAAEHQFCTTSEETSHDVVWESRYEYRVAADLKANFGAAIDISFVPRTPDEIDEMSENFVSKKISDLTRVNAFPLWTIGPPYFDIGREGPGFVVFIATRDGRLTLFESERLMHQSELVFTFAYFLNRSLADCSAALHDPQFASLTYKFATGWLETWCDGDGRWYQSTICGEEPLRREIVRFEDAYRVAKTQAAEMAQNMEAMQAYFTVKYLKEWSENLANLKDHWCRTYEQAEESCLD